MTLLTRIPQIYTLEVHEAEEGGFWGEIIELPGCVSQGETREELRWNIRDALEAVLETEIPDADITEWDEPAHFETYYGSDTPNLTSGTA